MLIVDVCRYKSRGISPKQRIACIQCNIQFDINTDCLELGDTQIVDIKKYAAHEGEGVRVEIGR